MSHKLLGDVLGKIDTRMITALRGMGFNEKSQLLIFDGMSESRFLEKKNLGNKSIENFRRILEEEKIYLAKKRTAESQLFLLNKKLDKIIETQIQFAKILDIRHIMSGKEYK